MIARSRVFYIVLTLAALVAIVMSVYQSVQFAAYNRCQSQVTEALIQSQLARAEAAEQDRASDREESAATADLIRAVFSSTSREQTLNAYNAYASRMQEIAARRASTDAQRQAHPLPAPPSQTCG